METPIIVLEECHLEAVCALEKLCFSSPWSEEQFKDAIHSSHFLLYGYFDNELLLAYLLVSQVGDYCEIVNIATNPNYRRKGYAYKLLDDFFQQNNPKNNPKNNLMSIETVLEVRSQNIAAQELYKKFGFVHIHTRKNYYADNGDSAFVMKRK